MATGVSRTGLRAVMRPGDTTDSPKESGCPPGHARLRLVSCVVAVDDPRDRERDRTMSVVVAGGGDLRAAHRGLGRIALAQPGWRAGTPGNLRRARVGAPLLQGSER